MGLLHKTKSEHRFTHLIRQIRKQFNFFESFFKLPGQHMESFCELEAIWVIPSTRLMRIPLWLRKSRTANIAASRSDFVEDSFHTYQKSLSIAVSTRSGAVKSIMACLENGINTRVPSHQISPHCHLMIGQGFDFAHHCQEKYQMSTSEESYGSSRQAHSWISSTKHGRLTIPSSGELISRVHLPIPFQKMSQP